MGIEAITPQEASRRWWWMQRRRYNLGLAVAYLVAIMLYYVLGNITTEKNADYDEFNFVIIFQVIAFFIMMVMANFFYSLGWIIDIAFNPRDSQLFRQRLFELGFWFSFALPILSVLYTLYGPFIWRD